MFKNLLVPFVFGAAAHTTARGRGRHVFNPHRLRCFERLREREPWASSEEFCYNTGTYNGVTVGVCSDCFGCARDRHRMATRSTNRARQVYGHNFQLHLVWNRNRHGSCQWSQMLGRRPRVPTTPQKGGKWCSMYTGGKTHMLRCKPDGGCAISVGIIIGTVVGLTLLIVSCCYCGRCGCFAYRRDQLIATAVATAAAAASRLRPTGARKSRRIITDYQSYHEHV